MVFSERTLWAHPLRPLPGDFSYCTNPAAWQCDIQSTLKYNKSNDACGNVDS